MHLGNIHDLEGYGRLGALKGLDVVPLAVSYGTWDPQKEGLADKVRRTGAIGLSSWIVQRSLP